MKNLLLILLATLFVACNEGTRYDEPTFSNNTHVKTTYKYRGEIKIKDVKWELTERYQPIGGRLYTLQPTYISVVRINKTELEGDSTDFSKATVYFTNPQIGYDGYLPTDFTYEETSSEIILNIQCPSQVGKKPTEEPYSYILVRYAYYTTF